MEPFSVATKKIWEDMQAYELRGEAPQNLDRVRTRVQMM